MKPKCEHYIPDIPAMRLRNECSLKDREHIYCPYEGWGKSKCKNHKDWIDPLEKQSVVINK